MWNEWGLASWSGVSVQEMECRFQSSGSINSYFLRSPRVSNTGVKSLVFTVGDGCPQSERGKPPQKWQLSWGFVAKGDTALGLELLGAAVNVCAGYLVTETTHAHSCWKRPQALQRRGRSACSVTERRCRPRRSPGYWSWDLVGRPEPSRLPNSAKEAWCACVYPPQGPVQGGGKLVFWVATQ